jgi:hypothetical protein
MCAANTHLCAFLAHSASWKRARLHAVAIHAVHEASQCVLSHGIKAADPSTLHATTAASSASQPANVAHQKAYHDSLTIACALRFAPEPRC